MARKKPKTPMAHVDHGMSKLYGFGIFLLLLFVGLPYGANNYPTATTVVLVCLLAIPLLKYVAIPWSRRRAARTP